MRIPRSGGTRHRASLLLGLVLGGGIAASLALAAGVWRWHVLARRPAATRSTADRHAERAENPNGLADYLVNHLGLRFGVPHGVRARAVRALRRMAARPALAGAATRSASSPTPTWQFIGPAPMLDAGPNFGGLFPGAAFHATGRITAIAIDPTTSGRLFVGAASGGVWMSTEGGTTFEPIGDALPTQAIGALALDTGTAPPTIYVATGEGNNGVDSY